MKQPSLKPAGSWDSPVSAEQVATACNRISEVRVHGDSIYWLEQLADQKGRSTIVRYCDNQIRYLLQKDFNCRSRVHEYGGGAFAIADNCVYFVNDADQQIHVLSPDGQPRALTRRSGCRYADLVVTDDFLIAIEEDHHTASAPLNRLVSIHRQSGKLTVLCASHDFHASPAWHQASGQLAWLCWNQPNMPWDGTSLMLAKLNADGSIDHPRHLCGSDTVSVFQPRWSPDGLLYHVCDQTGWWNLYRFNRDGEHQAILPMQAEFGLPQWVFGQSMYCFTGENKLIACCNRSGRHSLLEIDTTSLHYTTLASDDLWFEYLSGNENGFACLAASADRSSRVIHHQQDKRRLCSQADPIVLDSNCLSVAQPLTIRSRHGDDIHANYYPPRNAAYAAPNAPPLIVLSHGGPTAQASPAFDIKKQFWTTRGFAILDVNYSGSTGYGRAYRDRLKGQWGRRDVEDVCDAARAAVELGLASADQLIIKGSSAGGYTVLAALTFENIFHAGASYYGISDLTSLLDDTHKFEARYLDQLIGPYPEQKPVYVERSPINHVEQLDCPIIFFQGDQDRVVPRSQAERMVQALDDKRLPVAYRLYADEQHGFRQAQTIIDALQAELCFYRKIFRLGADNCDLDIRNL